MKKINNIGLVGIIILIISSLFPIIYGIYLINGFDSLTKIGVFTFSHFVIHVLVVIPFVISLLILILSVLTIIFKLEFLIRLLGILGVLNSFFVWIFLIFPLIFTFVGGILTYCGKIYIKRD